MENKWLEINRTSTDENEQAEYGMDALDLDGTREFFQREAVKAFGQDVTNFSLEPFAAVTLKNGTNLHPR
ncbi:MAG: hypothetical protein JOZ45_17190 [Acidobacteriaceae bacterium]|nr:hypothetical protein [Acidobacteriaceae bacterium]